MHSTMLQYIANRPCFQSGFPFNSSPHLYHIASEVFNEGRWHMYDKDFQYTLFIVFQLLHMAFGKWQKGRLIKPQRNQNAFKYDVIGCK